MPDNMAIFCDTTHQYIASHHMRWSYFMFPFLQFAVPLLRLNFWHRESGFICVWNPQLKKALLSTPSELLAHKIEHFRLSSQPSFFRTCEENDQHNKCECVELSQLSMSIYFYKGYCKTELFTHCLLVLQNCVLEFSLGILLSCVILDFSGL